MPHKRNPIISERIGGLARVLRGNASAAMENVALWHERDISHSGVERIILPDSTILLDYMQHLAIRVVRGLVVDAERMRANLELTHGALFSQRVLLALVAGGLSATTPTASSRSRPSAPGRAHAAARAARRRPAHERARPRRDLRLRRVHPLRRRADRPPRRDRAAPRSGAPAGGAGATRPGRARPGRASFAAALARSSPRRRRAPARGPTSARWASTPRACRVRSSGSPRAGRRRCRATSTSASSAIRSPRPSPRRVAWHWSSTRSPSPTTSPRPRRGCAPR